MVSKSVEIADDDPCAAIDEEGGNRLADAVGGTGDEDSLTGEARHWKTFPDWCSWAKLLYGSGLDAQVL
ncbi:hypothetical protein MSAR_18050 [Mycolicibacterium sarraceniae]|uniref:Uncharacterized protein n=1 Tax=Mycolicibacterium sarraceniae TaxID=1534348 RepID=A0A7I7SR92_9MYCO|nr:hypothetical protein MSAR_18050 [Mycolicibacterium sarraceniae]